MYSLVVLMALTTGNEATEARRGGCSRGGGYSSCYSGGCGSGYTGGYSSCYSGSCGSGYCGTVGYTSYSGCGSCGSIMMGHPHMIIVPEKPKKDGKQKDGKEDEDEIAAPATLVVTLPENATLTIDGEPTVSTSSLRVFTSPQLEGGKEFHYTLKARVMRDGKPVVMEKRVAVRAGETTQVSLTAPTPDVAAR